jgi:TRAP-type C4-dicarboxylate transport system substrate-binding protein
MIKGMGAIPTPVEISEIMPALMTGLVDGQENPLNNIIARKMWEANKFVMMTSHMESVLATFINEKAWQGIPAADRKIMQDCFAEMGQRSLKWAKDAEADEVATLKKNGVTIIDEKNGLDLKAFRDSVGKQILTDYPNWGPYIAKLKEVKG